MSKRPKLNVDALPANTQALLSKIVHFKEIDGFCLIGGTALALEVAHRHSEDIDLCWVGTKLPRPSINSLMKKLADLGYAPLLVTNEAARLYWENDGTDLDDFQQDWNVDNVKLSFVVHRDAYPLKTSALQFGHLRIASTEALFAMKSRLLVNRTTLRDLYDIWWFLTYGEHTIHQVVQLIQAANPHYSENLIRRRLLPSKASLADPGVQPLLPDGPTDFESLIVALRPYVDKWEQALAATVIKQQML